MKISKTNSEAAHKLNEYTRLEDSIKENPQISRGTLHSREQATATFSWKYQGL